MISFLRAETEYTPLPFPVGDKRIIVPFWADVDITNGDGGTVFYREVERKNGNESLFSDVDSLIRANVTDMDRFHCSWIFIATWHEVAYYGSQNAKIVSIEVHTGRTRKMATIAIVYLFILSSLFHTAG